MYAEVEENEADDREEWEELDFNVIEKETFSYIQTEECLESGYTYLFKLLLKNGDVLHSNKLPITG